MKSITMDTVDKLKALDRNSYIQKNLLMCRFDKVFETKLTQFDADNLTFLDILQAPKYADADMVYSELKKIVKHGLSAQDKELLYNVTNTCLQDTADHDFDTVIEEVFLQLMNVEHWQRVMGLPCRFEDQREESVFYFHKEPFWMAEYFVELPWGIETEAILVQNGHALCVRIVKRLADVSKLWPLLSLKGNSDFYFFRRKM